MKVLWEDFLFFKSQCHGNPFFLISYYHDSPNNYSLRQNLPQTQLYVHQLIQIFCTTMSQNNLLKLYSSQILLTEALKNNKSEETKSSI